MITFVVPSFPQVTVVEASGLPREYSHYVFCLYQFWGEYEPMIIPPMVQPGPKKLPGRVQRFEHSQVFNVDVTEELLEFIDNGTLSVEVWGHRRTGFMEMQNNPPSSDDDTCIKKLKTLPERLVRVTLKCVAYMVTTSLVSYHSNYQIPKITPNC